jgi:zinc and cadmium transporter
MEGQLPWIVAFTALGGVLSVLGAAVFLLLPDGWIQRLLSPLVSFAIGALLGAAFLALLPHAFESFGAEAAHRIPLVVLAGVLGFFLLEKLVLWRHCHSHECEVHGAEHEHPVPTAGSPDNGARAAGNLILIGDGIHNLVDGVLIAAAFLTDVHLGIVTSLAVIAHEIPQELGDFAILLHSGYSRARALFYNVLTSLTTVVGGVVAYFSLSFAQAAIPYVLAVAAASFIYIAVADLIPNLHKRPELRDTLQQVALILLGVGIIAVAHSSLH